MKKLITILFAVALGLNLSAQTITLTIGTLMPMGIRNVNDFAGF